MNQLERERINEIKSLNPDDVEKYIYNLTKGLHIASENFNPDGIKDYQDKLEELMLLLRDKNSDLLYHFGRFDSKFSTDLLFYHRRKDDLNFLLAQIKRMIDVYQNLRFNFWLLERLVCFMYMLFNEIDLNLIKFYDYTDEVDDLATESRNSIFSDENHLIKYYDKVIDSVKINVWFDLDELKNFIKLFNDFNVDEVIENIESYVKEVPENHEILVETDLNSFMDRTLFILKYFKDLLDENVFDELAKSVEGFIDSDNAFEKYSIDFHDDISSEFKDGILEREPKYNLKDCRFIVPVRD